MAAIQIRNLSYTYSQAGKPALNNINLDIEKGEYVLILGPSGCGKSTLSLCFNGLIPHVCGGRKRGEVIVDGVNIDDVTVCEMAKKVGIVFQDPEAQLCNLVVRDEIVYGLENMCVPREIILERLEKYLAFAKLGNHRYAYTYSLSGGEKQRLALASILAMDPEILILDEPTSNIDPAGAASFLEAIDEIMERRDKTILIIDHQIDELASKVDRIVVIDDGSIVADGTPRKIFSTPELCEDLGVWIPQVTQLAGKLSKKGYQFKELPLTISEMTSSLRDQGFECRAPTWNDEVSVPKQGAPKISINNLSCVFGKDTEALRGVNLEIMPGDFLAIIGPNGSGKTTLMKHLVGLLKPQAGKITLGDHDLSNLSIYDITAQVGYVFQYPEHQFVTDKVYDEVAYSLRIRHIDEEVIRVKVEDILSLFGLQPYADRHPFKLSMGQKRRLSVATMLVVDQKVIILDEPTMGLDCYQTMKLLEILSDLNAQGQTVIIVTHDMKVVAQWAKRCVLMLSGNIIFDGSPRELFGGKHETLLDNSIKRPPIAELSLQILNDKYPSGVALTVDELATAIIPPSAM